MNADEIWLQRVAMREVGGLHLSIGTSLAIESFCGILPDSKEIWRPVESTQEIWINLRTLVRNMHGALDHETKDLIAPESLLPALQEELLIIEGAVTQYSNRKCKVVFYVCGYTHLERVYTGAVLKDYKTDKQLIYRNLEQVAVAEVLKHRGEHEIIYFPEDLKGNGKSIALITHCPIDLLSKYSFNEIALLESHTGTLKRHTAWNTKLSNGKELTRIPFNKMTLQVFGDGIMFSPMPIKIRRFIVELAEKSKWTTITQKEKIIYSIKQKHDPVAEAFYIGLF